MTERWQTRAACAGKDYLFFPRDTTAIADESQSTVNRKRSEIRDLALRHCRACPVITECNQLAVDTKPTHGIWGGREWNAHGEPSKHHVRPTPAAAAAQAMAERRAERLQDYRELRAQGHDLEGCAARLGLKVNTLEKWLERNHVEK